MVSRMVFIAAAVFMSQMVRPVYAQITPPTTQPATQPAYAESKEGLTKLIQDILAASKANEKNKLAGLIKDLHLPKHEAWFKQTFGDETGAKLATEYGDLLKKFDEEVTKFFADVVKEGKSDVSVRVLKSADDKEATGLQKDALVAMKQKVTLYTVELKKPGEKAGTTLWSFVYAENGFRLAGKMRAIK